MIGIDERALTWRVKAKPLNEDRLLEAVRRAVRGRPGGKPRILYVEDDTDLSGVITALLAGVLPAWRATKLNPVEAMRQI